MAKTKRKRRRSPTAFARDHLRAAGYIVGTVERFAGQVRVDLFGFADLAAVGHRHFWLVQVTSKTNLASRVNKALGRGTRKNKETGITEPDPKSAEAAIALRACLEAGIRCSAMGVDEVGEITERIFTLEDVFHVERVAPKITAPPKTQAAMLGRILDLFEYP
jgi:hypothetical protein